MQVKLISGPFPSPAKKAKWLLALLPLLLLACEPQDDIFNFSNKKNDKKKEQNKGEELAGLFFLIIIGAVAATVAANKEAEAVQDELPEEEEKALD